MQILEGRIETGTDGIIRRRERVGIDSRVFFRTTLGPNQAAVQLGIFLAAQAIRAIAEAKARGWRLFEMDSQLSSTPQQAKQTLKGLSTLETQLWYRSAVALRDSAVDPLSGVAPRACNASAHA